MEGRTCPFATIIGRFADVAAVRNLDIERAALQDRVTKLESEAREWWHGYCYLASMKRAGQPDAGEEYCSGNRRFTSF